jgi:hypothetical protein
MNPSAFGGAFPWRINYVYLHLLAPPCRISYEIPRVEESFRILLPSILADATIDSLEWP